MNTKVIVVDVESTCWDGYPPRGQKSEIIEIGICLLNTQTGEITKSKGILVYPENSTVSKFCTQLTTLTQDMLEENAISFEEACEILEKEYDSTNLPWASYGFYDKKMFEQQCRDYGVNYPFSETHTNVKDLFAKKHKLPKGVGMDKALKTLNIPLEGTHHRGVDDAKNIAKILRTLI